MTVRAMFQLVSIKHHMWGSGREFTFSANYDTTIPEENRFFKASPSGQLVISVDNEAVFPQFTLGKKYYLDFNQVPEPEVAKPATPVEQTAPQTADAQPTAAV